MGMRWASKVDAKHATIAKELRQAGCSVAHLFRLKGVGDILVGIHGACYLFEIKSDKKISHRSAGKLTPDEKKFVDTWRGQHDVIESAEEALAVIRREERRARGLK